VVRRRRSEEVIETETETGIAVTGIVVTAEIETETEIETEIDEVVVVVVVEETEMMTVIETADAGEIVVAPALAVALVLVPDLLSESLVGAEALEITDPHLDALVVHQGRGLAPDPGRGPPQTSRFERVPSAPRRFPSKAILTYLLHLSKRLCLSQLWIPTLR